MDPDGRDPLDAISVESFVSKVSSFFQSAKDFLDSVGAELAGKDQGAVPETRLGIPSNANIAEAGLASMGTGLQVAVGILKTADPTGAVSVLEDLVKGDVKGALTDGASMAALPVLGQAARSEAVRSGAEAIGKYLGKGYRAMVGENGSLILQSKDGLRELRFDLENFHPHDDPHVHIIEYENVKNKKKEVINIRKEKQ